MGLLEKLVISLGFGFGELCLKFLNLQLETALITYFVWCTILSWNNFHKCDSANYIYVIIHVEKKYNKINCSIFGKFWNKKWELPKT